MTEIRDGQYQGNKKRKAHYTLETTDVTCHMCNKAQLWRCDDNNGWVCKRCGWSTTK